MAGPERITRNISCIACGYNLRGLEQNGECTECGGVIAESMRPERLLFADDGWLRSTVQGSTVLTVACTGLLAALLFYVLATCVQGAGGGMIITRVLLFVFPIAGLFTLLMAVVFLLGVWWVTVAEPPDAAGRISDSTRWLPRVSSLFGVLMVLTAIAMGDPAAELALLLAAFSFLVVIVGTCGYLAAVFQRVPDPKHAVQLRGRGRGLLYSGGAFLCLVQSISSVRSIPGWLAAVFGIIGFAFIGAVGLTFAIIRRCRRPLKNVRATADRLDDMT